jgi:hypothetical protein
MQSESGPALNPAKNRRKYESKRLVLLICIWIYFVLSPRTGICQDAVCKGKYDSQVKELVYPSPEINASFPGGISHFHIFLNKELHITAEDFKDLGLIIITFTITSTGKAIVREIKANGAVSSRFAEKVHKAFGKLPRWTPAKCDGKNVAARYKLPIYN